MTKWIFGYFIKRDFWFFNVLILRNIIFLEIYKRGCLKIQTPFSLKYGRHLLNEQKVFK